MLLCYQAVGPGAAVDWLGVVRLEARVLSLRRLGRSGSEEAEEGCWS